MGLGHDDTLGALVQDKFGIRGQLYRGWTNFGLRSRPIGRWTYQVTAGSAGAPNTHNLTVGGVSICGGAVTQAASNNATATAIATAINANAYAAVASGGGYYATVSTDTVTIRQRKSGAITITKTVAGDATGTLTAAFASSDTWTEALSGATFDGNEYYELGWDGSQVIDLNQGTNLTNATVTSVRLKVTGQAFELWAGEGVATSSNVILAGDTTAADTWTEDLPWVNAAFPLTIKLAADAVLSHHVKYF